MLREGDRLAATVLVAALTLVACAKPTPPGVRVRSINTDIGLGIPKPAEPASVEFSEPAPEPEKPRTPVIHHIPRILIPPPVDECPAAGPNAAPSQVVPPATTVEQPKQGRYAWNRYLLFSRGGQPLYRALAFRTFRDIRVRPDTVAPLAANLKSFEVDVTDYAPPLTGPTFEVDSRTDTYRVIPSTENSQRLEPYAAGVFLERTIYHEFTQPGLPWQIDWTPQVQMLPFPAAVGALVPSTSQRTDAVPVNPPQAPVGGTPTPPPPATPGPTPTPVVTVPGASVPAPSVGQEQTVLLQALALGGRRIPDTHLVGRRWIYDLRGKVQKSLDVDVCGTLIDTWPVRSTLTLTTDNALPPYKDLNPAPSPVLPPTPSPNASRCPPPPSPVPPLPVPPGTTPCITQSTYAYTYAVAPQLGGLIVYEQLDYPASGRLVLLESGEVVDFDTVSIVYSMGSLEPVESLSS